MVVSLFLTHFSLKWHLQSFLFLLHFAAIDIQEAKDSIDEEDSRPARSTWSYITMGTKSTVRLMRTLGPSLASLA